MIEKENLIVLKNLMETVLDEHLDKRLAETETRILEQFDERLDKRLTETEAKILNQVD